MLRFLTLLALSATLGLSQAAGAGEGAEPADRQASAATRTVLKFLKELPARKERKLISGQFPEWYPRVTLDSFRELEKTTGHTPGILSLDYFETFLDDDRATRPVLHKPARWQAINPLFVEHWRAGGLVTLSVHMTHPWSGKKAWDRSGDLRELVEDGKPAEILRRVLDPIAEGLADLQRQGVVVMFRPYHELTLQSTFWWSGKDAAAFQNLWRATFHYFTEAKQLHNLLWVFNPNSGCGPQAMDFYPGDGFVDMVSLDLYSVDLAKEVANYEMLVKTGKPFALSEFGPGHVEFSADTFAHATLGYDYGAFAGLVQRHFPETVFYVAWRGPFSLNKNLNAGKLLGDAASLNLEHLKKELSPRMAAGALGEPTR
jgi:mannan endo-1,4-beta-mannosidase